MRQRAGALTSIVFIGLALGTAPLRIGTSSGDGCVNVEGGSVTVEPAPSYTTTYVTVSSSPASDCL